MKVKSGSGTWVGNTPLTPRRSHPRLPEAPPGLGMAEKVR